MHDRPMWTTSLRRKGRSAESCIDRAWGVPDTNARDHFVIPPGGYSMTKSRLFQVFAPLVIVAFLVFGQQVVAQAVPHNYHTQIVHRVNPEGARPPGNPPPADNLYPIQQAFVVTPVPLGSNSDGTDLWPCFGGSSANPDCPTIGDPSIT